MRMFPVFWTDGHKNEPAMQAGTVVVRPEYVAFLPLGSPMGAGAQFAHGFSSVFAQPAAQPASPPAYPLHAWWQRGPRVFDDAVWDAARSYGGLVIPVEQGAIVWKKHVPVTFTSTAGRAYVTLGAPPPLHLLSRWRPGVLPFPRARIAKVLFAIVLGSILLAGCVEGLCFAAEGALRFEPLGFVAFVVLVAVGAFALRAREHRADLRAVAAGSLPHAPYR